MPSSQYSSYETLYAEGSRHAQLDSGDVHPRRFATWRLQPLGTSATDKSIIPTYATYFYDTWHVKPSFTLTYGLGWNLEMPPYELNGNQVALVDSNNQPIDVRTSSRSAKRRRLQGSLIHPTIGYTLVRNVGRVSSTPTTPTTVNSARAPPSPGIRSYNDGILGKIFGNGKTVIRGGYGRIFGRLNGVDLVLVPLLGPGLLQGVTCLNPQSNGQCAGSGVNDPTNAFRIGTDGLKAPLAAALRTLAQPFYPGVGTNPETVDPRCARSALQARPHRQLHAHHSARDQPAHEPRSGLHRQDHPQ